MFFYARGACAKRYGRATGRCMKRILIVEDNEALSKLLELNLADQAWETELVHDGRTGVHNALTREYDLVILDMMLPGLDGLDVLKQLRKKDVQTPVLILTSRSSELDRVLGLELGADDYVTKPFSIRELIARIKAIFRRMEGAARMGLKEDKQRIITCGDLSVDPEKRKTMIQDRVIELTAKEFDLLYFFASHPGRVFNRSQLLDRVWGYGHDGYEHTVNSNINRLRAKLETDPASPKYILTVWGVGYKFREG